MEREYQQNENMIEFLAHTIMSIIYIIYIYIYVYVNFMCVVVMLFQESKLKLIKLQIIFCNLAVFFPHPQVDPVEALPSDLVDRARPFFSALLWYCMDMLCWEESNTLPSSLLQGNTAQW